MGMDVYGRNPSAPAGEYFGNSVWGWHPLWDYCCAVAPNTTGAVASGHSNDGDAKLAAVLTRELESGRTTEYEATYTARLAALADERCEFCEGTGTRRDAVGIELGMAERGHCNGCNGKGAHRPWAAMYPFSAENVAAFRDFVAASGGFEIR